MQLLKHHHLHYQDQPREPGKTVVFDASLASLEAYLALNPDVLTFPRYLHSLNSFLTSASYFRAQLVTLVTMD